MKNVSGIIPLGRTHVSFVIMISRKKRGRPIGTMRSAGYAVSTNGGGRPHKTTELDGYDCNYTLKNGTDEVARLWQKFATRVQREVKRATDP